MAKVSYLNLSYPSAFDKTVREALRSSGLQCTDRPSNRGVSGCRIDSSQLDTVGTRLADCRPHVAFVLEAVDESDYLVESVDKRYATGKGEWQVTRARARSKLEAGHCVQPWVADFHNERQLSNPSDV